MLGKYIKANELGHYLAASWEMLYIFLPQNIFKNIWIAVLQRNHLT